MGSQNITWDIIYIFNNLILRRNGHLKAYIDFFFPIKEMKANISSYHLDSFRVHAS